MTCPRWKIVRKPVFEQRQFRREERIIIGFIDPDGAAESDDELGIPDRTMAEIIDGRLAERDVPPFPLHDRRQQAQILECHMAERDGGSAGVHH